MTEDILVIIRDIMAITGDWLGSIIDKISNNTVPLN